MGSDFKFALRNVLRNKRRSLLTAASIFTGAVVIALMIGFINGLIDNFESNYVDYQTGDLKVTTKNYVKFEKFLPVDETMTGTDQLSESIKKIPGVETVEERMRFGILMGNDQDTVPAFGIGADLFSSRLGLSGKILKPGTLEKEGLYIGYALADKLHLKVGDEILLATKTTYGGLNGIKVRVKGLLSFGVGVFDRKFFFLDLANARKLLKMQNLGTELLIFTKKGSSVPSIREKISSIIPKTDIVRDIAVQVGGIYNLMTTYRYICYFFDLLIVLLASFVIISTMMQAVFERMREIGTLKAMGMTDREIFAGFTLEGAIIGAIGALPGGILGYLLVLLFSISGIPFDQMKTVDMPLNFIVYPYIGANVLILTILMAVFMSSVAAMIPARSAGRLMPAEALRKL